MSSTATSRTTNGLCFPAWLAVVVLIAGCPEESAPLDGHDYLLDSSQGFEPVKGTGVALVFADGQMSFSAGCNNHFGAFSIKDGKLVVAGFGANEIGCDPALHQQDEWLATFFTSRPNLLLDGDRVTFKGKAASLVFLDREVADPDRPLVDTAWTVDTFISGDAASDVPIAKPPTLLFRANGSLEVFTGCVSGGGQYKVDANQVTFSSVLYGKDTCEQTTVFADTQMKEVIKDGKVSFEIDARRLTIQASGNKGIAARAQ